MSDSPDGEARAPARNQDEPQMAVRDRDLRALVHTHGAGPGTPLHDALQELQRWRDEAAAEAEPEPRSGRPETPRLKAHLTPWVERDVARRRGR